MQSITLRAKLGLGVVSSYSRPRLSNANPYSESLFRTVKDHPRWLSQIFERIDDTRVWRLACLGENHCSCESLNDRRWHQ